MEENKKTYSDKKVVAYYKNQEGLQKPEQTLFNLLKNDLCNMKMLDIGIGAGRTTACFAPYVKEYIGVDYAEEMVKACQNKFASKFPQSAFQVADARKLDQFAENEFDFVLFSFNGIDYMNTKERFETLKQINRVLKPGGVYSFSTHNINSLQDFSKIQFRFNIFALIKRLFDVRKIKRINKAEFTKINTSDCIFINDGAHNFGLQTCYIRPAFQIKQLQETAFNDITVLALSNGEVLSTVEEINRSTEKWLYYLCKSVE
jgi:ubiquinone/menaquinone biosynthesis C-methylase UbiE